MKPIKLVNLIVLLIILSDFVKAQQACPTGPSPLSVLNASGNHTTKDHNKVTIGYFTQWDAWKSISGITSPGYYTQINLDFSKYTHINYSFFGLADDGSLISPDYAANQANGGWPTILTDTTFFQAPGPIFNTIYYNSWDLLLIWGVLKTTFYIGDNSEYYNLGYRNSGTGWQYIGNDPELLLVNGASGDFPLSIKDTSYKKGLFDLAHRNGQKVMASIGGWSLGKSFPRVANDPVKRKKLASVCKQITTVLPFDGIDLDWEYPGQTGLNLKPLVNDFDNLLLLCKAIRDSIGPNKVLSLCITNNLNYIDGFDFPALSLYLDYFNVFGYDYNGGWSDSSGHNGPLFNYPGSEFDAFNIDSIAQKMVRLGCPKNKITLGAGFYGRAVVCNGPAKLGCPTVKNSINVYPDGQVLSANDITNFAAWDAAPNYSAINALNKPGTGWTYTFDTNAKVAYLTKGTTFLSYDDTLSVAWKAKYIADNGYAGTLIWQAWGDLEHLTEGNIQPVGPVKLYYSPNTTSALITKMNNVFAATSSMGYTVSTSANLGGLISSSNQNVNCGSDYTVQFKPNAGYYIDSLFIDNLDSTVAYKNDSNYTFYKIDRNHSIRIVFATPSYRIRVTYNAEGGICSPSDTVVNLNANVNLLVNADSNYYLDSISINGDIPFLPLNPGDYFYLSLNNIQQDLNIYVHFEMILPPTPPILDTCVTGRNLVLVSFYRPTQDGGSSNLMYQVSTLDSTFVTNGTSSPITIKNIQSEVNYTFRVRARNEAGWSDWAVFPYAVVAHDSFYYISTSSDLNSSITPSSTYFIKSNPTITYTAFGNYVIDSVIIDNQDSSQKYRSKSQIIFYQIDTNHSVKITSKLKTFNLIFNFDTNGGYINTKDTTITYGQNKSININAKNNYLIDSIFVNNNLWNGTYKGYASFVLNLNSIIQNTTVRIVFRYVDLPLKPTIDSVVAGNQQVTVYFKPNKADSNATITNYYLYSTPGYYYLNSNKSPIVVKNLENGVAYKFIVRAYNSRGYGPYSDTSLPAIPSASIYNITTSADANSQISPSMYVNNGGSITITYQANSGYIIDSVVINNQDSSNLYNSKNTKTFFNVTENQSISVYSKLKPIKQFYITNISDANSIISNSLFLDSGSTYRVSFSALQGYYIDSVIINNINNSNYKDSNGYTFVNISMNQTIKIISKISPQNLPIISITSTNFNCPFSSSQIGSAAIKIVSNYKPIRTNTKLYITLTAPQGWTTKDTLDNDSIYTAMITDTGIYNVSVIFDAVGLSNYSRNYEVKITAPQNIQGYYSEIKNNKIVLNLSGAEKYEITLNNSSWQTTASTLTLNLNKGVNNLSIKTDATCQESIHKTILISEDVVLYPNPAKDVIHLYCSGNDVSTDIELRNASGVLISKHTAAIDPNTRLCKLNVKNLTPGIYFIRLHAQSLFGTYKFIKN